MAYKLLFIPCMRKPRMKSKNAIYHVCARANRQEMILENKQFKHLFLEIIKRSKKKFNFKLRNFAIMGNHIHLDIQPAKNEDLSKIMQWILSVFAIRFNKIFNYKGHVWYDRFKSKIINSINQYINTFIYISNNPVRANLVNNPLSFEYSAAYFYQNKLYKGILEPPSTLINTILNQFITSYDYISAKKVLSKYSFRDKKPGRPRKR